VARQDFLQTQLCGCRGGSFQAAIRQNSKDEYAYYYLARCYEIDKKNSEAVANYRKYLSLAPKAEDRPDVEKRIRALMGK
jgi:cytochrome c-type biogenesis protein CcmH/NrfG